MADCPDDPVDAIVGSGRVVRVHTVDYDMPVVCGNPECFNPPVKLQVTATSDAKVVSLVAFCEECKDAEVVEVEEKEVQ